MTQAETAYTDSYAAGNPAYTKRLQEVYDFLTGFMEPGKVYTAKRLIDALMLKDKGLSAQIVYSTLHHLRARGADIVQVCRGEYMYPGRRCAAPATPADKPAAVHLVRQPETCGASGDRRMRREGKPFGVVGGRVLTGRVWEVYSLLTEIMTPGKEYTVKKLIDSLMARNRQLSQTVVSPVLRKLHYEGSDIVCVERGSYMYKGRDGGGLSIARGNAAPAAWADEPVAVHMARHSEPRAASEEDRMLTALACLNVFTREFFGDGEDEGSKVPDILRGLDCFAELAARWLGVPDDAMAAYRLLVAAESAPLLDDPSYRLSKNLESAEILFQMLLEDGQTGGNDAGVLNAAFEYLRDFRESCAS